MSITSLSYAIFIIITIILYYCVKIKYRWIVLLVASYFFYICIGYNYLIFILITTVSTYLCAYYIFKGKQFYEKKAKIIDKTEKKDFYEHEKKKQKILVALSIFLNFGILIFFKYHDIVSNGLYNITGNQDFKILKDLILPIGISFYMFQSIGYVIDVYRGKHPPEKNPLKFALFVSFFPQIIQGPISRFQDLAPQLFKGNNWNDESVKNGLYLIMRGLFKKMIIADRLAVLVNSVLDNYKQYNGSILFFTMLIYGVQVYCDFSGGIDIIRGISKIFSINMIENFKRPLFATSVMDFWRRWHITLGSWMRDYVFYPLSLSKWFSKLNKNSRRILGPKIGKILTISVSSLIVYILVGLWHGPSLKFVVFGLWHGGIISLALIFEDIIKKQQKRFGININSVGWRILQILITTILVCIGRYFSKAISLGTALSMLKRTVVNQDIMSLFGNTFLNLGLSTTEIVVATISVIILIIYEICIEINIPIRKRFEMLSPAIQIVGIFMFLYFLVVFGIYSQGYIPAEFIYMKY